MLVTKKIKHFYIHKVLASVLLWTLNEKSQYLNPKLYLDGIALEITELPWNLE
jgi:hypothetical protein